MKKYKAGMKYHNIEHIRTYFDHRPKEKFHQIITDNIANDLDIDRVFIRLDRTNSKIGQQYLYAKLRTIYNINKNREFNNLVEKFDIDSGLSERSKKELSKLSSDDGYCFEQLFQGEFVPLGKLTLPYILTGLLILFILLSVYYDPFFILLLLPIYIFNAFLHYKNKRNILSHLMGIAELSRTLKIAKRLAKENEVRNFFQNTSFIERLHATKIKTTLITFENRSDNDLMSIIFIFIELMKIAINYEVIMFNWFLKDIIKKRDDLRELFCFIGIIDTALSVSILKKEENLCNPLFKEKKCIQVEDIIHPLVKGCVPNSLIISDKSLLLTGSNMSGKTTFIRAIAINIILAQTLGVCFASSYVAPFFKIFTSIRIRDNVEENTSYYLEEVLTIKEIVEQVNKEERCLFVLDELFKGTNTLERVAASKSILTYLNSRHHIVFVSTHDIELTSLLPNTSYDSYHFSEQVINQELLFDYKLYKGELRNKNAIKILSLYNFPTTIIEDAVKTQDYLSSEKV